MNTEFYTLASWHVIKGNEEEFIKVWKEHLASAFREANKNASGTLI